VDSICISILVSSLIVKMNLMEQTTKITFPYAYFPNLKPLK